MPDPVTLAQALDYANRANPYPFYAQLRGQPVSRQADGSYVVSTYREIMALLHDPRVSSDLRNRVQADGTAGASVTPPEHAQPAGGTPSFITLDPPEHDRLRRLAMHPFGPPDTPGRIDGMETKFREISSALIDGFAGKTQIDIVEDFAYPLPVSVICELLGVPREDEPRFHAWAEAIVNSLDLRKEAGASGPQRPEETARAFAELGQYMAGLVEEHLQQPKDDLMTGLISGDAMDGHMTPGEIVSAAMLLFIAGHETTVNLIANGMLTLLRHPSALDLLRREPQLIACAVEELLRYEPPVQILPQRTAIDDIAIAGTTIPKGSPVLLLLAAGNRDPDRFPNPDQFDPKRQDNQHLGFGSSVHSCFGAPLARLEVQIALTALIQRLQNPRLVVDPPPYRLSPILRGPRHLFVNIDGVSKADTSP